MKSSIMIICLLALFTSAGGVVAQQKYVSPVTFPIVLAGNVGELRTDAFHAGIDIRGMRGVGSDVLAVAGGFVSRVGVSPWGYGNVLYVTHADGAVSVYGHLDGFKPEIAKWVRAQQYAAKSFAVNLYPGAGQFPVKQGEKIGMLGNTGNSGGAHLHLEIRSPRIGMPINIIKEGVYNVPDREKPQLKSIKLYEIDTVDGVEIHRLKKSLTPSDTMSFVLRGRGYLAYEVVDYKDGKSNTMGVYSIEQRVNGEINYSFTMDFIDFNKGRCVNTLTHYAASRASKHDVIRAYVSNNNPLSIYKNVKNRGIITAAATPVEVRTVITDDAANEREVKLVIKRDDSLAEGNASKVFAGARVARWGQDFSCGGNRAGLWIAKGSLYDDALIEFSDNGEVVTVGSPEIALHKAAGLSFNIQDSVRTDKVGVVMVADDKKLSWIGGSCKGSKLSASIKRFGKYRLMQDLTNPRITPLSLGENGGSQLKFKITDDLSGVESFYLTVNGSWELAELDGKTGTLIYRFTRNQTPIGHEVVLVVADAKNNRTTFKKNIQW